METLTVRVRLKMPRSVAVATEGPASRAVIEAVIRKLGLTPRVLHAEGKPKLFQTFDKILTTLEIRFSPDVFLVVPDLHPEVDCTADVSIWKKAIESRFPRAILCTAIWETESWLLGDPKALEQEMGKAAEYADPDRVGGAPPSKILQALYRQKRGYARGAAFDKAVDGARLVAVMDVRAAAKRSGSLARFIQKAEGAR